MIPTQAKSNCVVVRWGGKEAGGVLRGLRDTNRIGGEAVWASQHDVAKLKVIKRPSRRRTAQQVGGDAADADQSRHPGDDLSGLFGPAEVQGQEVVDDREGSGCRADQPRPTRRVLGETTVTPGERHSDPMPTGQASTAKLNRTSNIRRSFDGRSSNEYYSG